MSILLKNYLTKQIDLMNMSSVFYTKLVPVPVSLTNVHRNLLKLITDNCLLFLHSSYFQFLVSFYNCICICAVVHQGRNQRGGKGGIAPPVKVLCPPSRVCGLWNYIKSTATQCSTSMYCSVYNNMHAFMLWSLNSVHVGRTPYAV